MINSIAWSEHFRRKSACDAPYDDYFQKLSASWNASESAYQQLRHWLDPVSSGVTVMDGFDPVAGLEVSDDTITNIFSGEPTRSLMYANDKGYIGGCNNNHITSFAREFYRQDGAMVTGIQLF